jgi:Cytochrome bd terminal oxidase subunit I
MDLTALLLSRLQLAFTVSFHIIFPSFTIGLAAWLTVLDVRDGAYRLIPRPGDRAARLPDRGLRLCADQKPARHGPLARTTGASRLSRHRPEEDGEPLRRHRYSGLMQFTGLLTNGDQRQQKGAGHD